MLENGVMASVVLACPDLLEEICSHLGTEKDLHSFRAVNKSFYSASRSTKGNNIYTYEVSVIPEAESIVYSTIEKDTGKQVEERVYSDNGLFYFYSNDRLSEKSENRPWRIPHRADVFSLTEKWYAKLVSSNELHSYYTSMPFETSLPKVKYDYEVMCHEGKWTINRNYYLVCPDDYDCWDLLDAIEVVPESDWRDDFVRRESTKQRPIPDSVLEELERIEKMPIEDSD